MLFTSEVYSKLVSCQFPQSFHFSPRLPGKDWASSEAAHEARLAALLQLGPGKKCLDVGCGVGGPMRTIASTSGAHVTGITINDYQVARGVYHNTRVRLLYNLNERSWYYILAKAYRTLEFGPIEWWLAVCMFAGALLTLCVLLCCSWACRIFASRHKAISSTCRLRTRFLTQLMPSRQHAMPTRCAANDNYSILPTWRYRPL